jgi:hypothetical protein
MQGQATLIGPQLQVEVAAAADCFFGMMHSLQVKNVDRPWMAQLQNYFVVETFPPRRAYEEKQWRHLPPLEKDLSGSSPH